jgi:hypothetical protein
LHGAGSGSRRFFVVRGCGGVASIRLTTSSRRLAASSSEGSSMARNLSADIPGVTDPDILYHYRLGIFHAVWSTVDIASDMAVGHFMALSDEEALMVTWGMMFGAKAKLLATLIKNSQHERKAALMTALNALRGNAKRDVLAHGYQLGGEKKVGFIEKPRGNDFTTRVHIFTHEEFRQHVNSLIGNANAFQQALGFPQARAQEFSDAAANLAAKS